MIGPLPTPIMQEETMLVVLA